ncbi:hypothetical protein JXQ31_08085 [candidate division KSB1 bacterium]|nr:hypothetical protein [candidate division KSB1 bacterium]
MDCVIYATIFGESVTDIPFLGVLPVDTALYLQATAAKTVQGSMELWI